MAYLGKTNKIFPVYIMKWRYTGSSIHS